MFSFLKTAASLFMGGNGLVRIGVYALGGLLLAGSLWLHGYMSGRSGADSKALRIKIARLERALDAARDLQESHNAQTTRDDALDQKNKELIDDTPENSHLCFGFGELERLRQLR